MGRKKPSIGGAISALACRTPAETSDERPARSIEDLHSGLAELGIRPLPRRGGTVTNEMVNQLREDDID